jgi:flagellar motor switch protein FliG
VPRFENETIAIGLTKHYEFLARIRRKAVMAMLDRYQKTGGFVQLVSLLETCGQAKQEKFLEIIRAESSFWADALKTKVLSIERIYTWNDETIAEIFGTLQDLTVAVALISGPETLRGRVFAFLSHGRRRKIEDIIGINKPTPGEVAAMPMIMVAKWRWTDHCALIALILR